ncbi:MAG: DNA topoisomerase I [Candidatus Diapherotrites archaeon]|nr:DNA topoisomerase I [Candidatus Diapherotrites archaeon]
MRIIVAEKAIAAKRIAEILGSKAPKAIREGKTTVYDIGDDTLVIPMSGHVLNVDYPPQYNNWRATNLNQLIRAPLQYKPSMPSIVNALKKYAKNATRITIATDYDTEGESIGLEAITIINKKIQVDRAHFSAITPEEVKHAFGHLVELDYNLADSADCRREVDLIWGAVLTRFVSLASGRLGRDFLSVGRVQTPMLALIVDREKERRAFKPTPYWEMLAIFHKQKDFEAQHSRGRFLEEPKELYKKLKTEKTGTVKSVQKKKKNLSPPTPFNTTEFLRSASGIGVGPSRAMSLAESLYTSGFISYPRTDNTVFPESIKLKQIVESFRGSEFDKEAKLVLSQKKLVPTKGKKQTTDHPPIHPVAPASSKVLPADQWKVYELIVRRFFATLLPKCELDTVRAVIDLAGEDFIANGQTIHVPGWKEVYTYSKTKEVELPHLEKGDSVEVKDLSLLAKETQPPKLYTPAALIKELEDKNLGTKSTRPAIIKKLLDRHYIRGTKNYEPTEMAFAVISVLEKVAPDITSPKMTSELEKEMQQIGGGKKEKPVVVDESRKMLGVILDELTRGHGEISKSLRGAVSEANTIAKCECGGDLRIITSRASGKRFVGCSRYNEGCRVSYPLPQKGKVIPLGTTCESCGSPKVKIIHGRRSYEICLDMNCETKKDWGKRKKKPKAS